MNPGKDGSYIDDDQQHAACKQTSHSKTHSDQKTDYTGDYQFKDQICPFGRQALSLDALGRPMAVRRESPCAFRQYERATLVSR